MNNNGLVIFGGIALIFFLAFSRLKKGINDVQDYAADTFVGQMIGLTTVEGSKAKEFLQKALFLNHNYYNWLTDHFDLSKYDFSKLDVDSVNDIANDIIDSNYVIFDRSSLDRLITFGFSFSPVSLPEDKPSQAIGALNRISNQLQALQVVDRYYTLTQKNLGSALAHWLPNDFMVMAYTHLKDLPSGIKKKGTDVQIKLPSP